MAGLSTKLKSRLSPGVSSQVRPSLPRPADWCPAATSVHSGEPASAMARAVALVDSVTSSKRTGASRPAAASARSRSVFSTSVDSHPGVPDYREPGGSGETQGADRQPRGDRGSHHPNLPGDGHPDG